MDFVLLADGSSDKALLPILRNVVEQQVSSIEVNIELADLRRFRSVPKTLTDKIIKAVEAYPCCAIFVHRDAENQDPNFRYDQINEAMENARLKGCNIPHICVVPIRMQEAWLLIDESAIRRAAANPGGANPIDLPSLNNIENIANPKETLYRLLKIASGLKGRRLKKFRPEVCAVRVTEFITDFNQLRALSAFRLLERDIRETIRSII